MAGSPCPIEVMNRVVEQMGAGEVTIAYGLTEASPVITQTDVDDPIELRVGTVGRALPGVEVIIVDPDSGEALGDGEQGELCARGHDVMIGYYKMPEATAAAIDADGWLHTGDLAVRDAGGNYRITGRIKDMVIRGGENIYPREVEEFLYGHPKVKEVQVVGVPGWKARRGAVRVHQAAPRRECRRRGDSRLLQGAPGSFQGAALRRVRRRVSAHRHRQGAEVQAPRARRAATSPDRRAVRR